MVRAARSKRVWAWRAGAAVAAGLILLGNVASDVPDALGGRAAPASPRLLAAVNARVAVWFAVASFLGVCVLAVQVVAPAVAEERKARRWDALLTTDLRGREILFGKLVGCRGCSTRSWRPSRSWP